MDQSVKRGAACMRRVCLTVKNDCGRWEINRKKQKRTSGSAMDRQPVQCAPAQPATPEQHQLAHNLRRARAQSATDGSASVFWHGARRGGQREQRADAAEPIGWMGGTEPRGATDVGGEWRTMSRSVDATGGSNTSEYVSCSVAGHRRTPPVGAACPVANNGARNPQQHLQQEQFEQRECQPAI